MSNAPPTDEMATIVERAKSGDVAAFRKLFQAHKDQVARIVMRVMGPSNDLDDVVQEVFVNVHRSLPRFRGDSKFSTWLYRISVNVTRMHIRKKKSRPKLVGIGADDVDTASAAPTPIDDIGRQRRIAALYRLVETLSDKKREVLVLHDFQGMTAAEVAELVDCPVMTVRTRLFHARQEVYGKLDHEPELAVVRELVSARIRSRKRKTSTSEKRVTQ